MSTPLAAELLAIVHERDMATHPFIAGVRNGDYSREAIGFYAAHVYSAASRFPRVLSAILTCCDDPVVRRSLIGNLLEEEGATRFDERGAVVFDPERRHAVWARRFVEATGAIPVDDVADVSSTWLSHALRSGDWISPLAFITIGHEANVPQTFALLVPALRDLYGFSDDDLVFFIRHITADEHHGAEGAAMVASVAEERGARRQAIDGTRRGARSWWAYYSRLDQQLRRLKH